MLLQSVPGPESFCPCLDPAAMGPQHVTTDSQIHVIHLAGSDPTWRVQLRKSALPEGTCKRRRAVIMKAPERLQAHGQREPVPHGF